MLLGMFTIVFGFAVLVIGIRNFFAFLEGEWFTMTFLGHYVYKKINITKKNSMGKEVTEKAIAQLWLPSFYLVHRGVQKKCRTHSLKVLRITSKDGLTEYDEGWTKSFGPWCSYKKGQWVYPDKFELRYGTCKGGIHFFFDKQDAIYY